MNKLLLAFFLVCTLAGVVVQHAAAQAAQKPQIKDIAEYNRYVNAVQQADLAAQAQAIEAFLQTYPNSVIKGDALVRLMGAYQKAGNASKTIDTAGLILQADPNNVRALALLAYYYRNQQGADALKNAEVSAQYAQKGLGALPNTPKPEGMSDADFAKFHFELTAIFDGAIGFNAFQKKDLALAQKDLREAVQYESQPDIADIYPLAAAYLEAEPLNPEGFWFAIKAAGLAQGVGQQQILDYARKKYTRYHGHGDGWADLVKQAQGSQSVMPPAGFTVAAAPPPPSPADTGTTLHISSGEEWAVQKVQKYPLNTYSVSDWESVLMYRDASPANKDAADEVWAAIQAMERNGQGKLRIPTVKVIASTREGFDAAATESNKEKTQADVRVVMEKPMLNPPAPGSTTEIIGVIASYSPKPFMFIVEKGELPGPKTLSYPQPAMDPDAERHFEVDIDMGDYEVEIKDYKSATSSFRQALQYKPDDPKVTFKLADSLDKAEKFDEARAAYQRYLELLPNGPLAGQAKIALQRIGSASHK